MDIFSLQVIAACALLALLAHGALLLNDGVYGDSVILEGMLQPGRVDYVLRSSSEFGRPMIGKILAATVGVRRKTLMFRIIAVVSMAGIGALTYLALLATGLLDKQVCAAAALLATCYPGNQMNMDYSIALLYYFFQLFFLAGAIAIFTAARSDPGLAACYYVLAAGLFFLGFQMESTLVYFFGLPLALCAGWMLGAYGQAGIQPLAVAGLILPFPFLHWRLKGRLTPKGGANRDYNNFRYHPVLTKRYALQAVTRGVAGAALIPFKYAFSRPWGLPALAAACLNAWVFYSLNLGAIQPAFGASLGMIGFGFLLLGLAAAPYIVVLQPTGLRGWATKNNALFALPFALIVVGAFSLALKGRAFAAFLGFALAFYAISIALAHLHWVAVWAKHRALLAALSRRPESGQYSIFSYVDRHPVSGTFDGHEENYNLFIVFLLDRLWGGLRHMAVVEPEPRTEGYSRLEVEIAIQSTTVDYMLRNVDRNGAQAALTVEAGELALGPIQAALRYIRLRLTSPGKVELFLQSFVRVIVTPLDTPVEPLGKRPWARGVAPHVVRWKAPAEKALGLEAACGQE